MPHRGRALTGARLADMLWSMDASTSPTLLLTGALLFGAGIYLIQRSRFLVPAMMQRSHYLRTHIRAARALVVLFLTLGILFGGMGCRIVLDWFRNG
jgi:hypothetical protein